MGVRIEVTNFRCLRKVDWSPDGVCALVGPNGSGKTTLLEVLNFLRIAFQANLQKAIENAGGSAFVRNWNACPDDSVQFKLTHATLHWQLDLPLRGRNLPAEELVNSGNRVFSGTSGDHMADFNGQKIPRNPERLLLRTFADLSAGEVPPAAFSPPTSKTTHALMQSSAQGLPRRILDCIENSRVYGAYNLEQLRAGGSQNSSDMQLQPNGLNAFAVLRNWRDKRDYRAAYEFVRTEVCRAFPGVADDLEFDFAGQTTNLRMIAATRAESTPAYLSPNGWLVGLLHLMGVAGAKPGSVIAFDEFENSLHPYAVRRLVQAMRDWVAKKDLAVVLAGHSIALLDEFREEPERVFVMEANQPTSPVRLTDYRDPEWLKHFSLGELYRHEDFGGPKTTSPEGIPTASVS